MYLVERGGREVPYDFSPHARITCTNSEVFEALADVARIFPAILQIQWIGTVKLIMYLI